MNNQGERMGLLNQSVFDNTMMNETTDSIIEEYKHQGPPPKAKYTGANSGKFKASDLVHDSNLLNVPNTKEDNDMSFASKNSIENMSAAQIEVFSAQMNREQFYAMSKC